MQLENPNPTIFNNNSGTMNIQEQQKRKLKEEDPNSIDPIDNYEIFDLIKTIKDPEHALTLNQLNIISVEDINVLNNIVTVYFTPTIPHCSMAQNIGLTIKIKLLRSLPKTYKVRVFIKPDMHIQEKQINKQLQDKERILAAQENPALLNIINYCIRGLRK